MRPALLLALALAALAALAGPADAKGGAPPPPPPLPRPPAPARAQRGGSAGRARFSSSRSSSRSRSSSSRSSSATRSAVRRTTTSCRGCYYSGGSYYHRTYFIMYMGYPHNCYSCGNRYNSQDPANEESLTMSIPAITGTIHAVINPAAFNSSVLVPGSGTNKAFVEQLGRDVSALTGGDVPADAIALKLLTNETLDDQGQRLNDRSCPAPTPGPPPPPPPLRG